VFDRIFMQILDLSKTASFVILIVIAGRLLLKKAPKVFSYALWAIVLFRLLCPVAMETQISFVPKMTSVSQGYTLSDEPISVLGASEAAYQAVGDALNGGLGIQHIRTMEEAEDGMTRYVSTDWWSVWILFGKYVWVVGMAVMLLYSAVSYLKIRKQIQIAVPLKDNILIADDIKSPFVIGFIRPKIYLPYNLGDKEQEYIILHEQHHIRRFDHIVKAAAFLALTIHWFNPLVWIAFVLACKDMEMSCDEAVIRALGDEVRADYSASLLTLATGHRIIAGTPLAFGEGDTKGRIRNLSKWKKPAIWVMIVTVIVCIVLGVCLLTDQRASNSDHVGVTYYYGTVTDQAVSVANEGDGEGRPYISVQCDDGREMLFWYDGGNTDIPDALPGQHVQIRARIQEPYDTLVATRIVITPNTWSDNLEEAIQNAILDHHWYDWGEDVLECANFITLASEGGGPAATNKIQTVIEYGIVYYQNYRLVDGALVEEGGCNVPTVLTFRINEEGKYILAEYWEPRDGSYYSKDIRAKYPAFVWPDTQAHLLEQKIAVFRQVMDGFGIGKDIIIDHLITDICDRERWAAGFENLMEMCDLQCEVLSHYGSDTLRYCAAEFTKGGQDDLRGNVMSYVCKSILRGMRQKYGEESLTGQAWFDDFIRNTPGWQGMMLASGASETISFARAFPKGENTEDMEVLLQNCHNGKTTRIMDPDSIAAILDFLSTISGNNPVSSKGYYGGSYALTLKSGDDTVFSIVFADDDAFFFGDYGNGYPVRYTLADRRIDSVIAFFKQYDSYVMNPDWGITLTVERVTPNGLTIVCTQSGGNPSGTLMSGRPFVIQVNQDGSWSNVKAIQENIFWTTEGWGITRNGTVRWNENWEWIYGSLAPGHYRIGKTIIDHRGPGYDDAMYYAEFIIE